MAGYEIGIKEFNRSFLEISPIKEWNEIASFFERKTEANPDWFLPLISCEAVGGDISTAIPLATAIACLQGSIILIDDILDDEPESEYRKIGPGKAANLAASLQTGAFALVAESDLRDDLKIEVIRSLTWMLLTTAKGQHSDVDNRGNEEDYWRVVDIKSTPFYSVAFELGAIAGNANLGIREQMKSLGKIFGEVVQLHDDLFDAFHVPPKPDWQRPENNLLTLYALTADHKERKMFTSLLPHVSVLEKLEMAQQILIRSGAVSYCVMQLLTRYKSIKEILNALDVPRKNGLEGLFQRQLQPAMILLDKVGADIPDSFKLSN